MIFVTVGTHEQPFNRLLKYMDEWAETHEEEVVMQTGYSDYIPKHCRWKKLYSYTEMADYVNRARITITHGGPSSFVMPLQIGKIPVVVPRKKEFREHVNNHQMEFCEAVAQRMGNIIVVEKIEQLESILEKYDEITVTLRKNLDSGNALFCKRFEEMVLNLFSN